jgi:hypothetical protein
MRDVHASAGPAVVVLPGLDVDRPQAREQRARIVRVHRELRAPGVLVHEQRLVPGLAAVRRLEDPALLLRPIGLSDRAGVDDVGVVGIDDHARDVAGGFEPHVGPGLARVHGLVDAVAHGVIGPDQPGLARARPHDAVVAGGDGERADRGDVLVVEDGRPLHPAVRRLEDSAGGGADVDDERVPRLADDRGGPVADGAEMPEVKALERVGGGQRRPGERRRDECRHDQPQRCAHCFLHPGRKARHVTPESPRPAVWRLHRTGHGHSSADERLPLERPFVDRAHHRAEPDAAGLLRPSVLVTGARR